jgi:hypothetical protein
MVTQHVLYSLSLLAMTIWGLSIRQQQLPAKSVVFADNLATKELHALLSTWG